MDSIRTVHSLQRPPARSQRPRQPLGWLLQENILIVLGDEDAEIGCLFGESRSLRLVLEAGIDSRLMDRSRSVDGSCPVGSRPDEALKA